MIRRDARLWARVAVAVAVFTVGAPRASADEVCWNFEGETFGDHGSPYTGVVGSPPFFHGVYTLTNLANGADFEIVTHNGSRAVEPYTDPPGDPDVYFKIEAWHDGTKPTYLSFALGAYNGAVTVKAYNSSNSVIWDDVFAAEADHFVEIEGVGTIDRVEVFGGDREVFVDAICVDIP